MKNKKGRPKFNDPTKRHNVSARIAMRERDLRQAKAMAEAKGYSLSGWVRMLIKRELET